MRKEAAFRARDLGYAALGAARPYRYEPGRYGHTFLDFDEEGAPAGPPPPGASGPSGRAPIL